MGLEKTDAAALAIVLFAAACAPPATADVANAGAEVLATVDGAPAVTVDDVLYHYRSGEGATSPVTPDDVGELVEEIATSKILILEAEARGYDEIPAVAMQLVDFRFATLRDGVRETLVAEDPVSEEELRAFHETDSRWRKCAVILCKNRSEAEAAYSELDGGTPWDDVWERYSIDKNNFPDPGTRDLPVFYDGRKASAAVFSTPVGQYTPPVPANDGIRWHVFRVDKIVHGRIDTFEEAAPALRTAVESLKTIIASRELVDALRVSVPVRRDEEMWDDLQRRPFADFRHKWGTGAAVVSSVGGVPVYGRDYVPLITDFLFMDDGGLDAYRARDPDDFAYVTDRILAKLEDDAFMVYEAVKRGLDRDPALVRTCRNHRAELLTDMLINREFVAGLPPLSEADVRRYYDEHPEQFLIPEMLECYIIALPDAELVRGFHARVVGGESIVDVGEAYNRKRGRELADAYEPPPRLPPEKEDFVRAVTVLRRPDPQEREFPLVADLRTRIFDRPEPGTLSDVFQLADGRWAFYEVTYYRLPGKEDYGSEWIRNKCRELAWSAYLQSDEVNDRAGEWLVALRAKHNVAYAPDLYAAAAAAANSLP